MKRHIMIGIVVLLLGAGCYCGYRYYDDVIRPEQEIAAADDAQNELFLQVKPSVSVNVPVTESIQESEAQAALTTETAENLLAPAEEINEHTTAWLTIPGTHIDYPVVQGDDNDFYLHHGFDGQLNQELGCPFLDYRCNADFSGFNSIVYAHHMTKQRMFADIALFKDESFFSSHGYGTLILNDEVHTVQFFAYLNVYPTAPAYHAVFVMDSEKQEYLEYIEETADYCLYSTDELLDMYSTDEDDRDDKDDRDDSFDNLHLLLLSTCTYEFDDARGILVGVIE